MNEMLLPLQKMMAEAANISFDPSASDASKDMVSPFKLPIAYVDPKHLHSLSDVVVQDLELAEGKERSMYDVLFKPTNVFGKDMIQQWKRHYSSDPEYLRKTQTVIQQVSDYPETPVDAQAMREIWRETKESASDYFLEKYCFVEWDWLKFLNKSPAVLQILSVANMMSPVISLVMPFMFLLFPFLILKLRGIPITFSVYRDVLQDIARNHFIGKALTNLASLSIEKLMYFVIMAGLYFWQIYQNVLVCQRFHKNIFRVNEHLLALRTYAQHSINDMKEFVAAVDVTTEDEKKKNHLPPYRMFCEDVLKHVAYLENMVADLESVTPMTTIAAKVGSIGYLLQRYYELHTNPLYEQGLHYSFGFQGYLDNLRGVKSHLVSKTVNPAQLVLQQGKGTRFYEQVYPLLSATKGKGATAGGGVGNDCRLDKNMIITGPNASGKTTFLKTTSINVIFTQQIGCCFYAKCVLNPYTHIHSYLNIPDTSERDSLFQAESRRCKEILDAISSSVSSKGDTTASSLPMQSSSRHFCIFDELYSGTNPTEAAQAGYAFLKYLNDFDNVDFVLTTHYVSMCKRFKKMSKVRNYKMDVTENEDGSLTYKYQIKTGISKIQGAIRVLEEMGYPWEILDTIKNKND